MENIESKWKELIAEINKGFGAPADVSAILFLIGVQELGKGFRKFTKDEKVDLIHIAICTLFEKQGYYKFINRDSAGWPHWERLKKLPSLNTVEQEIFLKKAILEYFKKGN